MSVLAFVDDVQADLVLSFDYLVDGVGEDFVEFLVANGSG